MEEKQLNFNQPLLSVRRSSPKIAVPVINERKTNNSHPSLPLLPYYKSELKSVPVSNPGAIPFQWEQTPGKPKDENKAQGEAVDREALDQALLAPKLPPGRIVNHKQNLSDKDLKDSPASSFRFHAAINIPCNKALPEPGRSEEEMEDKDFSSSEDENVTYVDARDTLSWAESSFLNCSYSGVSGLDGQHREPSGAFSDSQTRDFMMSRFLPAAKAVASEAPQFASRKHPVVKELPKSVKKAVTWNKQRPRYYTIPDTSPHNIHGEGVEDEEEDNVDEYVGPEDLSAKLCGLLPTFCLLNPIPGMRDHGQVASSVRTVRSRVAYAGACSKTENRGRTNNHVGELKGITPKHALKNESPMKGHLGRNGVPLYKNGPPQLSLDRERRFLSLPEEPKKLRTDEFDLHRRGHMKYKCLSAYSGAEEITSTANPSIEKTLYVDSEQVVESRNSNSSSLESRGRNPSADYSLQEIKSLNGADKKAKSLRTLPKSETTDLSNSEKASQDFMEDVVKDLERQDVDLFIEVKQPLDAKECDQKTVPPLALAPLLLKSPSESWLSRTLSSISSNNPSPKSYLGNPCFRPSPMDPKGDKMRKMSNLQLLLLKPPGELAPLSEN